ncbi:DegT/DnrJ/EryC1/StrS family aminotransferase [Azospirillum himalayense]|uniref:DegT/DnrJ/EryC1/StrS family aminotransferase n=1 Tax=Azospirillum himalayense TaxID=654847 RepID=A0ABW0G185_9PROT
MTSEPASEPASEATGPIAFIDLAAQRRLIGPQVDEAVRRVFDHGHFIMGPEVARLEDELAAFCGARHAITCSNGTDAIALVLRAEGIGPGDAVFCPSFTFAATAEVAAWVGATPVFADVDPETFTLDPDSLDRAVATARRAGLRPAAVVAVDLFGLPADYDAIEPVCARHGLRLVVDSAQGFGAVYKGRKAGTIGLATTTSFFPAKPLGCYGDGGAVFTDDDGLAAAIRSLRVHGQGSDKYDNVRIGMNARLDTVQAAVLIEKLRIFPDEIAARGMVARRYAAGLAGITALPSMPEGRASVWAQYTLRIAGGRRDAIAAALKAVGVPTAVYYPRPLHRQTAYAGFPLAGDDLPVSERLAGEVLSLPMHPYLDEATQHRIIGAVCEAVRGAAGG